MEKVYNMQQIGNIYKGMEKSKKKTKEILKIKNTTTK